MQLDVHYRFAHDTNICIHYYKEYNPIFYDESKANVVYSVTNFEINDSLASKCIPITEIINLEISENVLILSIYLTFKNETIIFFLILQ
jgi:hypothetical protein